MIPVDLTTPIQAHGEELRTLELQDPTFEQIQKLGTPVSLDGNGNFTINTQTAFKYIPELAGVPPSSLKTLSAYDLNNLCWAVWRFFMTKQQESQTKS
ncbi:phage tail assembly protein [Enterobacter sp. LU1]|uniref:phage tail assembly protein n=1 Tax=Enterobacter sp. LU1 TaxID=1848517 RepID=UPI0011EB2152|nr:phage tail assembly protein [Enterobacter sp. LU1]QEL49870.1 phage tail assembly protein [Enterobacter sp. LU1]